MSVTKADLRAAREGLRKTAEPGDIGQQFNQWLEKPLQNPEDALNPLKTGEYWKAKHDREIGEKLKDKTPEEQAAIKAEWAKTALEGGMREALGGAKINRYTVGAGVGGAIIGALVGGAFGGAKGAAIGGLIAGLGMYAAREFGWLPKDMETAMDSAIDTAVPGASEEDRAVMQDHINTTIKNPGTTQERVQNEPQADDVTKGTDAVQTTGQTAKPPVAAETIASTPPISRADVERARAERAARQQAEELKKGEAVAEEAKRTSMLNPEVEAAMTKQPETVQKPEQAAAATTDAYQPSANDRPVEFQGNIYMMPKELADSNMTDAQFQEHVNAGGAKIFGPADASTWDKASKINQEAIAGSMNVGGRVVYPTESTLAEANKQRQGAGLSPLTMQQHQQLVQARRNAPTAEKPVTPATPAVASTDTELTPGQRFKARQDAKRAASGETNPQLLSGAEQILSKTKKPEEPKQVVAGQPPLVKKKPTL